MFTMDQVIVRLKDTVDYATLESYIAHAWIKPVTREGTRYFDDIDIARVQLVHNLHEDMMVNEEAMDIVLSLLDQVYSHRERMRRIMKAIAEQPHNVQKEILTLLDEKPL